MSSHYPEQEILQSTKGGVIFLSLIGALILNLLPAQGILLILRPDFVALIVLYWSINQPHRVGISIAFGMGLLMDFSNISVLGQHAMAYCIVTYLTLTFYRRLRIFNSFQQAPQIGFILVFMQLIILFTGLLSGTNFPGWHFFLMSMTGMLIWPLVCFVLGVLQRPRNDPNAL